jgi:hypothetical protein
MSEVGGCCPSVDTYKRPHDEVEEEEDDVSSFDERGGAGGGGDVRFRLSTDTPTTP